LNKRRDALRREVRALIFDASRELAVLEGRPLPAEPAAAGSPAETPPPAAPSAAENDAADEPRALESDRPDGLPAAEASAGAAPPGPEQRAPVEAQARQAQAVMDAPRPTRPVLPEARPAPSLPVGGLQGRDERPAESPHPLKTAKAAHPPRAARPSKAGRPSKAARPLKAAPSSKAADPAKAAQSRRAVSRTAPRAARRPRQRLLPDIPVDGVDPQQAFSRTGVCFAYFVNNACWRVRDAYCNTALHMCIIRNCPVYHLHRDALERRFARKFEHFW
jgi:hypothetical protein